MVMTNSYNSTIPSLQIGSPITLTSDSLFGNTGNAVAAHSGCNIGTFNKICTLTSPVTATLMDSNYSQVSFNGTTIADMHVPHGGAASYIFANL